MPTPIRIVHAVIILAGAVLAIAAALGPWLTSSVNMFGASVTGTSGFFSTTQTGGGMTVTMSTSPTGQAGAAASFLLIGFILGLFHLICDFVPRIQSKVPAWSARALAAGACASTLIGTILGAAGPEGISAAVTALQSIGFTAALGASFGCAIAATILQALALGMTFLPVAKSPITTTVKAEEAPPAAAAQAV